MTKTIHPWATDDPVRSPFALPEGLLGRLAGWYMHVTFDPGPLLEACLVRPGDRVLEVGFGPGTMIRALADAGARVVGVDPSPAMIRSASRRARAAVEAGRAHLSLGTADDLGVEGPFDRIVSIHNVALWPDLERGLDELARVLAPGGRIVLAWHGGRGVTRLSRSLRLPDDKLERLEAAVRRRFDRLERLEHDRDTVFVAQGRVQENDPETEAPRR